ncbi:MAG: hypothetical protein IJF92_01050 [Bacilli bacterium]|nr:hypothetical protein [Bacilli bacterium]
MNKSLKTIIYIVILLIILMVSIYLYSKKLYGYFLISLGFVLIFGLLLILTISKKTDEESVYDSTLKTILKRYDSILVETSTIPDLENKNVMIITNIEDMIDASVEIRKPIYYKIEENYTTFILLDNQDISLYILKLERDVETPIEKLIKERKNDIEDLINQAKDSKNQNINIENDNINNNIVVDTPTNNDIVDNNNSVIANSNIVDQQEEITPITNIEESSVEGIQPIELEQPTETFSNEEQVELPTQEEVQSVEIPNTEENDEPQLVPQDNVVEDTSDIEEEIL